MNKAPKYKSISKILSFNPHFINKNSLFVLNKSLVWFSDIIEAATSPSLILRYIGYNSFEFESKWELLFIFSKGL